MILTTTDGPADKINKQNGSKIYQSQPMDMWPVQPRLVSRVFHLPTLEGAMDERPWERDWWPVEPNKVNFCFPRHPLTDGSQKCNRSLSINFIEKSMLRRCSKLTYVDAVAVCWKTDVSAKELHNIKEWTLGLLQVISANFCARKPPREAPKRCTYMYKGI